MLFVCMNLNFFLIYLTYILTSLFNLITLFLFDIAPGISFIAVAKNTIKSKSYKTGIFTALVCGQLVFIQLCGVVNWCLYSFVRW